jgi:hypothetical protein
MKKNDQNPIYVTRKDDFTGPHSAGNDDPRFALRADFIAKVKGMPAIRGWWQCPLCKLQFYRRKSCEKHMGLVVGLPAHCPMMIAQTAGRRARAKPGSLVILNQEEIAMANGEGELRDIIAKAKGYLPAYGCKPEDTPRVNRIGAQGEMAFCKWAGIEWRSTEGSYQAPDFMLNLQIRTVMQPGRRLIIHDQQDIDEWLMVLVEPTGVEGEFHIAGWMYAKDGKQPEFWYEPRKGGGAYFVSQKVLRSTDELGEIISRAKLED